MVNMVILLQMYCTVLSFLNTNRIIGVPFAVYTKVIGGAKATELLFIILKYPVKFIMRFTLIAESTSLCLS